MGRAVPIAAALFAVAAAVPAGGSGTVTPTGFAFGRLGGNIRPYRVSIENSGTVHWSGAVTVGRKKLASIELVTLNRIATETSFLTLPKTTNCPGALPDVASTYVRVGALTVRVHGTCVPRYARMWRALVSAVRVSE